MPIYTVNIRVLHFTQNYNREKVLQFLCGMRVLFLNLLTVTALFGVGITAPFFECDKLQDVCLASIVCVDCTAPGPTISWSINHPNYCTTQFGFFDSAGTEKSLTGNCSATARLINKSPNVSRLCFTVNKDLTYVTCQGIDPSLGSKTCPIVPRSKPSPVENVSSTKEQPFNVTWNSTQIHPHHFIVVVTNRTGHLYDSQQVMVTHLSLDLKPGGQYSIAVIAVNCNGESNISNVMNMTTEMLIIPNGTNIVFGRKNVTVSWNHSQNHCYTVKIGGRIEYCITNGSYSTGQLLPNMLLTVQIVPQMKSIGNTLTNTNLVHSKEFCVIYSSPLRPDINSNVIKGKLHIQVEEKSICDIINNCICPPSTAIIVHLGHNNKPMRFEANDTMQIEIDISSHATKEITGDVSVENECGIGPSALIQIESPSGVGCFSTSFTVMMLTLTLIYIL